MTQQEFQTLRHMANQDKITYTGHAFQQMLDRGIRKDEVKKVLSSDRNQLIEVQPSSGNPSKPHKDPRFLFSDPDNEREIIVVTVLPILPEPEIRVITVECASSEIWDKDKEKNPWLIRK